VRTYSPNCEPEGRGNAFGQLVRISPPPLVGKRKVWLALCEGSPADFEAEI